MTLYVWFTVARVRFQPKKFQLKFSRKFFLHFEKNVNKFVALKIWFIKKMNFGRTPELESRGGL